MNNDGNLDILVGCLYRFTKGLVLYINEGIIFDIKVMESNYTIGDVQLVEWDNDGDFDMITS